MARAFADVPPRGEHEAFLGIRYCGESLLDQTPLLRTHAALEHDDMSDELLQLRSKVLEVVDTLSQQDRRASLLEYPDDVIQDEPVAFLIGCECSVQLLDGEGLPGSGYRIRTNVLDEAVLAHLAGIICTPERAEALGQRAGGGRADADELCRPWAGLVTGGGTIGRSRCVTFTSTSRHAGPLSGWTTDSAVPTVAVP